MNTNTKYVQEVYNNIINPSVFRANPKVIKNKRGSHKCVNIHFLLIGRASIKQKRVIDVMKKQAVITEYRTA